MLTDSEIKTIITLSDIASILSILGSTFVITTYICYPALRRFSFKMVVSLAIADILNQLCGFVYPSNVAACYFQAISDSFFNLASFGWAVSIACVLYQSVIMRYSEGLLAISYWKYAVSVYGIAAFLTCLPFVQGTAVYGPSGGWCWITPEYEHWRFIQFYGPLWISIVLITFIYVKIWRILHALVKSHQTADSLYQLIHQIMGRLRYYPIILVVVWLPGTINRIYETTGGAPLFWLALIHRTFANSQGLLNAIVYGLNTIVKDALRRACGCGSKNPLSPSRHTRLEWFKQFTYSLSPPRYSDGKRFEPVDDPESETSINIAAPIQIQPQHRG